MKNRKHHFYIPLAVAIISTTVVVLGLFNYWFGMPRSETMWFCERVRPGFVKQPANTWSNFGFIIAGVYIGWLSYKNRFTAKNLMTASVFYPIFFACIVVFLGPGSIAMHGSNGPAGEAPGSRSQCWKSWAWACLRGCSIGTIRSPAA